eukprot:TRINITY_DN547_c0_g1_i2.p1 TRINITY_DN547_c0_g1~~TRINITY_DN547_c0_g1_i2.p1  ORF type:complete len:283 (+),score=82.73 TRINITY_DN547_c0_g1_i2:267-1115(+)
MLGRNARILLELMGRGDIPVFLGADRRIAASEAPKGATFVHGDNALGNVKLPEMKRGVETDRSATEFIIDACRQAPGEVQIIAIGPLTNVAAALAAAPAITTWARGVTVMGGSFNHIGNITAVAEANVHNDPIAAQAVFAADWQVVLCPLNVTHQTTIDAAFMANLAKEAPIVGGFLNDIAQFYLAFYNNVAMVDAMAVHDSTAILAVANPELFTKSLKTKVLVECGNGPAHGVSVADMRARTGIKESERNVLIHLQVDSEAFLKVYTERIMALEKSLEAQK